MDSALKYSCEDSGCVSGSFEVSQASSSSQDVTYGYVETPTITQLLCRKRKLYDRRHTQSFLDEPPVVSSEMSAEHLNLENSNSVSNSPNDNMYSTPLTVCNKIVKLGSRERVELLYQSIKPNTSTGSLNFTDKCNSSELALDLPKNPYNNLWDSSSDGSSSHYHSLGYISDSIPVVKQIHNELDEFVRNTKTHQESIVIVKSPRKLSPLQMIDPPNPPKIRPVTSFKMSKKNLRLLRL